MRFCYPNPNDSNSTYVFDDRPFYPSTRAAGRFTSPPPRASRCSADTSLGTTAGPRTPTPTSRRASSARHNYGFRCEVRFYFTYKGGEKLTFRVTTPGCSRATQVIDLAACTRLERRHDSDGGDAVNDRNSNGVIDTVSPSPTLTSWSDRLYEVVVFQAERRTDQSSYRLSSQGLRRRTAASGLRHGIALPRAVRQARRAGRYNDGRACSTANPAGCPVALHESEHRGATGVRVRLQAVDRLLRCPSAARACDLGASATRRLHVCAPTTPARLRRHEIDLAYSEQLRPGMLNMDATYQRVQQQASWGHAAATSLLPSENGEQWRLPATRPPTTAARRRCKLARPAATEDFKSAVEQSTCQGTQRGRLRRLLHDVASAKRSRGGQCRLGRRWQCDDATPKHDGCSISADRVDPALAGAGAQPARQPLHQAAKHAGCRRCRGVRERDARRGQRGRAAPSARR